MKQRSAATRILLLLALACSAGAHAQAPTPPPGPDAVPPPPPPSPIPDQPLVAEPPTNRPTPQAVSPDCDCKPSESSRSAPFAAFRNDPEAYSIVSVARGLSTHKPMYLLPVTYSPDYEGQSNSELVFQISAKQRLWGSNFYFGYTQRSFWEIYNSDNSKPFRETNYNPEMFYRLIPETQWLNHWGADLGIEHESNGESAPASRSWNRVYFSPFRAKSSSLFYLKAWYRIPEKNKEFPEDAKGDDNPDIGHYYGYTELHLEKQIGRGQLIHVMVRGNIDQGNGAINIDYTIPTHGGYGFYQLYLWQGYGESLSDYKNSVTRIGLGFALAR